MKIKTTLRSALSLKVALVLGALVCVSSTMAQEKEKQSQQKDDIQTSYKSEKVGSDKFEVTVRVTNNRPKAVRVVVQIQYEGPEKSRTSNGRTIIFPPPPRNLYGISPDPIELDSHESKPCEAVTIRTKKVYGVKILSWEYID
jgi:hypothetical protein